MGRAPVEPILRFADKVEFTDPCWIWKGNRSAWGYGRFFTGKTIGGNPRFVYAHRWSYEYFVGPIPIGLQVDHLCRVHSCVNPGHLEPVTLRDNILRGVSITAKHSRQTHCVNGHPFTPDNTYRYGRKRKCRECTLAATRQRYSEKFA